MLKKVFAIGGLMIFGLACTGCTKVMDLSEEETRLIAEYAGELLLSYDKGYESRLEDGEADRENMVSEDATTKEDTSEVTEDVQVTEKETENTIPEKKELQSEQVVDLAQSVGAENVSIQCNGYELLSQYPKDEDGEKAVQLDAPEGYELLVLKFDVTATQEKEANVALVEQEVQYELLCNGTMAAKPMLTILTNDLNTLEMTVAPGQSTEAVLIFQISESAVEQLSTMELRVTNNDVRNVITIL